MKDTYIFKTEEQHANAQRLRDFIANLPERQCKMDVYLSQVPSNDPIVRGTPECGTAACLAGWGAAQLAPTKFYTSQDYQGPISHAFVPRTWVEEHHLENDAYPFRSAPEGFLLMNVGEIGREVLGPGLAKLFTAGANWPEETKMTDKAWMLMVLDAALAGREPYWVARNARINALGHDPDEDE